MTDEPHRPPPHPKQPRQRQHPPLPREDQRAGLGLHDVYTGEEFETLKKGLEPVAMEDKWAIAYDAPWLYFRRSWTGCCVFAIRLEETGTSGASGEAGARIVESWASRNEDEYRSASLDDDRATLRFLIDALLLNKPVRLPRPPSSVGDERKQVYQHHVFGRTDTPRDE
jgi:hypothetical protein